jgi:uncharacterized protein with FMN-binding domain
MKKTFFSMFFVTMFGVYALFQRADSGVAAVNTAPAAEQIPAANTVSNAIASAPAAEPVAAVTRSAVQTTPTPTPTPVATPTPAAAPTNQIYQDGTFTGTVVDAYYGNVQVQVTTKSDRIADVQFLQYPSDRSTSVRINSSAMPVLRSEAIQAQSAQVNTVSGASDTSAAFRESLSSALAQARV